MKLALLQDVPILMSMDHNRALDEVPTDTLADLGLSMVQSGVNRTLFVMTQRGDEALDSHYQHAFAATI